MRRRKILRGAVGRRGADDAFSSVGMSTPTLEIDGVELLLEVDALWVSDNRFIGSAPPSSSALIFSRRAFDPVRLCLCSRFGRVSSSASRKS